MEMSPCRRTTKQPTSEYRATQSVLDWVSQLCQGSFTMAAWARCFLLPDTVRKAWQMCTGTRSWWWWWQTLMRKHNRHVMEDFQWKVWKYFNNSCLLIKSFSGSESSSLWQTWVVYTEANGNDDVDGADDINGEPPEMHIAAQIHL